MFYKRKAKIFTSDALSWLNTLQPKQDMFFDLSFLIKFKLKILKIQQTSYIYRCLA